MGGVESQLNRSGRGLWLLVGDILGNVVGGVGEGDGHMIVSCTARSIEDIFSKLLLEQRNFLKLVLLRLQECWRPKSLLIPCKTCMSQKKTLLLKCSQEYGCHNQSEPYSLSRGTVIC